MPSFSSNKYTLYGGVVYAEYHSTITFEENSKLFAITFGFSILLIME